MLDPPVAERQALADIDPSLGRGPRLPLAAALLGAVLLLALGPLALFSLLTAAEMKEALVVSQQERQLQLASSVAQRLDDFLDQAGREAVKMGDALAAFAGERTGAGAAPYLGGFLDDMTALVRFQPTAGAASSAVKPDLALPLAVEQVMSRDAQSIVDQGPAPGSARTVLLSGPFVLGPQRMLAVSVSAPVQEHGRLIGVLQEVAILDRVWREASALVPSPMRLFLLRADGRVAVGAAGRTLDETDQAIRQREIVQQFLRLRGRSRATRAYDAPRRDGVPRRVLGSFAATARSWGVFLEVDEKLALAPVERLRGLLTKVGVVAAIAACTVALLLGAAISRPIKRLAQISKRLADCDFSVQARASRVRELDTLAFNFNRMASQLGRLFERFGAAAREANDMFLGTIRALAEAIDEKDPYTKGHSVRVNRYSIIIGRYLGLSRDEMKAVQIASLLHDVGKIGIDDAILKKPAALLPEEFQVMKTHPERGAKIMGRIPQMKKMIPGMRFHHERYSGGGYPLGLRREEIPLLARIIAVADIFDAMTTDRPYQKSFPVAEAVSRINDMKGRQLDPQAVEAFNRACEAGEFEELFQRSAAPTPAPNALEQDTVGAPVK